MAPVDLPQERFPAHPPAARLRRGLRAGLAAGAPVALIWLGMWNALALQMILLDRPSWRWLAVPLGALAGGLILFRPLRSVARNPALAFALGMLPAILVMDAAGILTAVPWEYHETAGELVYAPLDAMPAGMIRQRWLDLGKSTLLLAGVAVALGALAGLVVALLAPQIARRGPARRLLPTAALWAIAALLWAGMGSAGQFGLLSLLMLASVPPVCDWATRWEFRRLGGESAGGRGAGAHAVEERR